MNSGYSGNRKKIVVLGKVTGHYGIKGWLKVKSYTRPRDRIFHYDHLVAGKLAENEPGTRVSVEDYRSHPHGMVVKFAGYNSREDSQRFLGNGLGIHRLQLDDLPEGEFYWHELIGLTVENLEGETLGRVQSLLETGANDVLVVLPLEGKNTSREWLVPWIRSAIVNVDLDRGRLTVDWDHGD
ncbi:MAG: ribosome maturation factor RimM [Gammaproteobacteria bacterium]|nr:ribosome maturation factor RimM [Gammaproteobacteria bacterium]